MSQVCEPHYESVQVLILTSCVFYFPTTMLLMYCYGTIYHSQKLKMKNRYLDITLNGYVYHSHTDILRHMLLSALPMLLGSSVANRPIKLSLEAETTASVVRSLSAVSLMFIIMVTPWAILQVITSVTMRQPPTTLDFTVNILFTSFNFTSPFMLWLLNPRMRRLTDLTLYQMVSVCEFFDIFPEIFLLSACPNQIIIRVWRVALTISRNRGDRKIL